MLKNLFKGKKVLIMGLGLNGGGVGATKFFCRHGAEVLVKDLKTQREQRHAFTYRMSRTAEVSEAKKSAAKAIEFRQLIEEYIISRQS